MVNRNESGSRIGNMIRERYQIVEELGKGSFGQTYLAQDLQEPTNPKCVVKYFQPEVTDHSTQQQAQNLFDREAEALKQVSSHPQIPTLLYYDKENFCIVQEFIDGHDISEELESGSLSTEAKIIDFLKQLAPVLSFIHKHQVIHRDIKPSNLRRAEKDGKLFLIDFGAVKEIKTLILMSDKKPEQTAIIGTEGYMPPEQMLGKPQFNSDLYALGVVCIYGLTGKHPIDLGKDPETGELLWQKQIKVSEQLGFILERMTHPDSKQRYQSADDLIQHLDELGHSGKTDLTQSIQQKKRANAVQSWRRFMLPVGIVSGVVVLGVILFPIVRGIYLFNQGNQLLQEEEYKEALAVYDQILENHNDIAEVWLNRGFALAQLRRFQDQLDSCERAIEINPELVEAINCKGLALQELGKPEEALEYFEQAANMQRDFYRAWNNKGEVLMKLNRPEEALEAFDVAKLYNPDYLFAWNNRGNALYQLGRYGEAIAAYEKAMEIDPNYPYAWNGRGNAQRQLERYEEAISDYTKAIELKSDFYEAWYNKGLALLALDRKQEALEAFSQAVNIKPDYKEAIKRREELRDTLQE